MLKFILAISLLVLSGGLFGFALAEMLASATVYAPVV